MNWLAAFLLSYTGEAALLLIGPFLFYLGYRVDYHLPSQPSLTRNIIGIFCRAIGMAAIAFAMHGVLFHGQLPGAHA